MSDISEYLDQAIESGEPLYTSNGSEVYILGNQNTEAASLGLKPLHEIYNYYGLVKLPSEDTAWGWWNDRGQHRHGIPLDIITPEPEVNIDALLEVLNPRTTYVAWSKGMWWSTTMQDKPHEINYRTYANLTYTISPAFLPKALKADDHIIDVRSYVSGVDIRVTPEDQPF